LGGRDVFSSDIKKVFDDLKNKEVSDEIRFLGLRE